MMKPLKLIPIIAFLMITFPSRAQLTINIRYSGENGGARGYVKEMEESGSPAHRIGGWSDLLIEDVEKNEYIRI